MAFVNRFDEILRRCAGKHVLHLGCADWPYTQRRIANHQLLHAEIAKVSRDLLGVDLSPEGLDMMRQLEPSWKLQLHDACTYRPKDEFDVIVASELIEHLDNPGDLLRGLAKWATPQHELILTTPNAQSLKNAIRALFGREYNHPDHTVLFSTQTLSQLLTRCGWTTEGVMYYQSSPGSAWSAVAGWSAHLVSSIFSQRSGDGMIVTARCTHASQAAGSQQRAA